MHMGLRRQINQDKFKGVVRRPAVYRPRPVCVPVELDDTDYDILEHVLFLQRNGYRVATRRFPLPLHYSAIWRRLDRMRDLGLVRLDKQAGWYVPRNAQQLAQQAG